MRIQSAVILMVLAVSITCIIVCSTEPPIAPINYAEGNCVGMVRDKTGSRVAGATLLLVPEGYSPVSMSSASTIDSTSSDEYGRYGFSVDAPGAYNLLAKGKGGYAIRRTIRIGADARVILDDEILREPGSMSGMVHLQGTSDHRGAIILLMGTNVYAKPFDSTGTFSIAALAEGSYILRILTAGNDYAAAETTVTVTSGMQTSLPYIELQKKFVPIIDSLSVAFDTTMMLVTLRWPAIDTARIKNYVIYCNRSAKNNEPIAIVDKAATTYSFDIFASPLDTFLFEISANKNDGIEGPSTSAKFLDNIIYSVYSARYLDTITSAANFRFNQKFYFDRKDNIFTFLGNKIIKLDPKGNYLGEFVLSDTTTYINGKNLCIDTAGNIYALVDSGSSRLLIKFDNDLQLVRELPLDSSRNYTMAVSAAGAFMLYTQCPYNDNDTSGTYRRIYDTQFDLVEEDSIPETFSIIHSVTGNDTTVCLFRDNNYKDRVLYFDRAFKEISSLVDIDFRNGFDELLSSSVPPEYSVGGLNLVLKNLFAVRCNGPYAHPDMLLFFDDHLQPVARMPIYYNLHLFSFDSQGNCYSISDLDTYNTIRKFSMAKVFK